METIRKWFSPERSFVRKLIFSPSSSTERVDCDEDGAADDDNDVTIDPYVQWCKDLETAEPYYDGFMHEVIDLDPGEAKLILVSSQISVQATTAASTSTTVYVPGRIYSAEGETEMLSNNAINTQHTNPPMWHVMDIWGVISLHSLTRMQVQHLFSTQQIKEASERSTCQFNHHPPSNYNDKLSPPRLSNQSTTRLSTSQSQSTIIPSDTDLSFFQSTQSHHLDAQSDNVTSQDNALQLSYDSIPSTESINLSNNNNLSNNTHSEQATMNNATPPDFGRGGGEEMLSQPTSNKKPKLFECYCTSATMNNAAHPDFGIGGGEEMLSQQTSNKKPKLFDFGPRALVTKTLSGGNQFLNHGGARYQQIKLKGGEVKLTCRRYHHPILKDFYVTRDNCKLMHSTLREKPQMFTVWLEDENGGVKWSPHLREKDPNKILAQTQTHCPGTLMVTTNADGSQVATLTSQHTCDCRPEMNTPTSTEADAKELANIVANQAKYETIHISHCILIRSLHQPTMFHMERVNLCLSFWEEEHKWIGDNTVQYTPPVPLNIFMEHSFLATHASLLLQLYGKLNKIFIIARREEVTPSGTTTTTQHHSEADTAHDDSDDDDDDDSDLPTNMKFQTTTFSALIPLTPVYVLYYKLDNNKQLRGSFLDPWQLLILPPQFNVVVRPLNKLVEHSYIFHLTLSEGEPYTGQDFAPIPSKTERKKTCSDPYVHHEGGDYQVSVKNSSYLCNTWIHPVFEEHWLTKSHHMNMVRAMNENHLAVATWLHQSNFIDRIHEIRFWPLTIEKIPSQRCRGKLSVTIANGTHSASITIAHECPHSSNKKGSMTGMHNEHDFLFLPSSNVISHQAKRNLIFTFSSFAYVATIPQRGRGDATY